jgi:hypothetical protein
MPKCFAVSFEMSIDVNVYAPDDASLEDVALVAKEITEDTYRMRDFTDGDAWFVSVRLLKDNVVEVGKKDNDLALYEDDFVHPDDATWTHNVVRQPDPKPDNDQQTKLF